MPQSNEPAIPSEERIDEFVEESLRRDGLTPSPICSDEVFVRRVYIDLIGTLPTLDEAKQFLSSTDPDKRNRLIDTLLEREEFADYWALKWGDLLRIKAEFPSNLWPNAAQLYHRWVRDSIRSEKPYDQFVRELLTSSGSNFRVAPVNFYRAFQERTPRQIFENIALVFMGTRLESSGLTEDQILGMSAFFSKIGYKNTAEWKEEIVFVNPEGQCANPKTGQVVAPAIPDGKRIAIADDPRKAFADWLTASDNPWFARNLANRIWYWLLGRGIIHEPDDIRSDNTAWSPKLLSFLEMELVKNGWRWKPIYRMILASKTYQRSAVAAPENKGDEKGFSHYRIRRMDAEPLVDAVCQITGGTENYTSNIPEPYTFLPNGQRAIKVADGSISSAFFEKFNRPPRNTSFESERANALSVPQSQHFLNSSDIQRKLQQSVWIKQLIKAKKRDAEKVEDLYLTILSRFPTEAEQKVAADYLVAAGKKQDQFILDLAWALLNTKEFILKH